LSNLQNWQNFHEGWCEAVTSGVDMDPFQPP
jgi:hypothetical protein